MRNPEQENHRRLQREMVKRANQSQHRGTLTRGRNADPDVNTSQLHIRSARQLRVLDESTGATEGDIGKFYFVLGYSRIQDENDPYGEGTPYVDVLPAS